MIGTALLLFAQLTAAQRFPQDCPTPATAPAVVSRARIDPSAPVSFRALAVPDTVYVGEQSEYQVAVFLSGDVRERLRRNPTFFPPDMPGVLAYDLPVPDGEPPRRFENHRCYDVLVYRRAIFPLLAGRLAIPPAQLAYSLALSSGFFSREESHEVRTDSAIIVAVEPPVDGRPAGYAGAVGQLAVAASLDGRDARVGDPVTLTVRVTGTGNVKLLPRPALTVPWATLVATGERVRVDSASTRIRGTKEFDWLLTPQEPGDRAVPAISYPYFDPDLRRYEVAETPAMTLAVTGAPRASIAVGDSVRAQPALAIRTRDRGPVAPPVHEHPLFWAAVLLAPLPALVRGARGRRRASPRVIDPAAIMRRAARSEDPRALRRAWLAALSGRLGVPVLSLAEPAALRRALLRAGVRAETADRARDLLLALDAASYDRGAGVRAPGGAAVAAAYDAVDAEAIAASPDPGVTGASRGIVLILALSIIPAAAIAWAATSGPFDAGVTAYRHADYPAAQRAFADAVRAEPRSADAWVNYGTAAWANADTIGATHGWERAARLDPTASDIRDHLELLDVTAIGDPSFVPPVGTSALAIAALLLWWGGWLALALRSRLGATTSPMAASLIAAATLTGAATAVTVERTDPTKLAVVRFSSALLATPESGAEQAARVEQGVVVRVGGHAGPYVRVMGRQGRAGWIEGTRLLPLAQLPER